MMSPFLFPVASCYSWFVRLLPRWGMMYIWSIQADVTNWVTSWLFVVALLPSLVSGVHVSIEGQKCIGQSYSTSDDPQLVNIDCTGLGGHDLGGFKDYDICIRTDKHGQSIYGPSVTPLESPGRDGEHHVSLVALGGSKAMHEFLVLHYMATDSAEEWDTFLDLCLPHCTWIRAGSRRALALHMFDKCHVAPSHRRLAHPSWIASMKLMLDLLLGARQKRYLRSRPFDNLPAQVYVRGFSAGSYSGICLLHLLWSMPHVQVGRYIGWHCPSSGIIAWDPSPTTGPQLMVYPPLLQTACVNGILMMTRCVSFRANIALWIVVPLS